MAAVIGSLRAELSATIARFEQDMGRAASVVRDVSREITRVGNDMRVVGRQMQDVGTGLTKTLTLPLVGVGAAALKMSTDMNASMANVATLIPQSTSRILELKEGVQDLAVEMGKSTADMSGGLYELISSIGDSSQSLQILAINAKAGAAGLASTKEAINFTTSVTKTYGDVSAAAFQKVSDLGFQAVNLGRTTFPELAAAIGGVAPIAKVAGVSLEEMFAVIATATGVTGNTSEVVTQMASALTGLLSPSKEMKGAYQELGVASGEALIAQRGFVGALQAVAAEAEKTGTPIIDLVGRKEAFILTASLAGSQAKAFQDRLADMGRAAGATDAAFKAQTQGLNAAGFAWQQFRAEIEVLAQRLGDRLQPLFLRTTQVLRDVIPHIERVIAAFAGLPESVQTAVVGMGLLAAAIGPLLFVTGQVVSSFASLAQAFGKTGFATRAVISSLDIVKKSFQAIRTAVLVDGGFLFEWGKGTVAVGGFVSRLASVVSGLGLSFGPLVAALSTAVGWFAALLNPVTLVTAAIVAVGLAVAALTGHWDDVKAGAAAVWQVIKDLGTVLWWLAKTVIVGTIERMGELARLVGGGILSALKFIDELWRSFGRTLLDVAQGISGPVVAAFQTMVSWLKDRLPGWVITLIERFRDFIAWTARLAIDGGRAVADFARNGVSNLHEFAEGIRSANEATKRGISGAHQLGQGYAVAVTGARGLGQQAVVTSAAVRGSAEASEAATAAAKKYRDAVNDLRQALSGAGAIEQLRQLRDAFGALPGQVQQSVPVLKRAVDQFEELEHRLDGQALPADLAKFATTMRDAAVDIAAAERAEDLLNRTLERTQGPLLGVTMTWGQLMNLAKGFTSAGGLQSFIDQSLIAAEASRRFEEQLKRTREALATQLAGTIELPNVKPQLDLSELEGDTLRGRLKGVFGSLGTDLSQFLQQAFTGGGGVLGAIKGLATKIGSAIGGAIGSAFGPIGAEIGQAVGSLLGPAIGAIKSVFSKPEWKKLQKDIGRDFGVTISDEMAKAFEADSKKFGREVASLLNFDKIIEAGGGLSSKNIDQFTGKLRDVFAVMQRGGMSAAQAAEVLDENFKAFADHWLAKGPLVSAELVEIVQLTRQMGVESKAVAEFIKGQIDTNILPGLEAFAGASQKATDQLAADQKKLAELQAQYAKASGEEKATLKKQIDEVSASIARQEGLIKATGIASQQAADALAASVVVAFSEMQKAGTPILEIATRLTPIIGQLQQQFESAGVTGGAAFDEIRGLVTLAADEIAGPALEAVNGLGKALAGLHNIGGLNQDMFAGLSGQIASTFNSLVEQGYDGGQVLRLMQQPLQAVWQLAKDFGYAVDEGTQQLLNQAEAAGVVGERQRPVQEQMLNATLAIKDAVTGLAQAFGVTLPQQVQAGAAAVTGGAQQMVSDVNGGAQAAAGALRTHLGGSLVAIGGEFSVSLPDAIRRGAESSWRTLQTLSDRTSAEFSDASVDVKRAVKSQLEALSDEMGKLPFRAETLAKQITDRLSKIRIPPIHIDVEVEKPEIPGGGTVEGFAHGTGGLRDFGAGTLAVLHGREAVVPEAEYAALKGGFTTRGGGDTYHITIPISALDGASVYDVTTRPGGIGDILIESIARGKRGRDILINRSTGVSK